jgi:Cu/Ag efflux pump CusA
MMLDNTTSTIMFSPMAVSLAFGVLLGTAVTLFLVPCLYMIFEEVLILTGMHRADDEQNETLQTGYEAS